MALIAVPTCQIIKRVAYTPPSGPVQAAIQVACKNATGVYLAARYVKGAEVGVTLQFAMRDQRVVNASQNSWFFLLSSLNTATRMSAVLNADDTVVIPVPVPSSIDHLLVVTSFPHTPGGGEGTLEIGAFTDEGQAFF